MTWYELREMVAEGESSTLEFKRKFTSYEKIAKEVIAFANTKGGVLLIGVDDDGTIKGIESEKSVESEILHTCGFYCEPPIEVEVEVLSHKRKDVFVVYVPESSNKPHYLLDPNSPGETQYAYLRVNDASVQAGKSMERFMRMNRPDAEPITLSVGKHERKVLDYLEQNDRVTVPEFASMSNISLRRASRLLVRLARAGVVAIHADDAHEYFTLY